MNVQSKPRPGDVWVELGGITDTDRLNWLESHLCYAMVVPEGRMSMQSLPNNGRGWDNGELRAAIDAAMRGPNVQDKPRG